MVTRFILNPVAGRGRAARAKRELERLLAVFPGDYDLVQTEAPGHAEVLARAAVQSGYERVVAIGGDGTVGEVLNGVADSATAMGIIPIGTGNDLAKCAGLPGDLAAAMRYLANPQVRAIDLGEESERRFGVIVGVGFPADVMYQTNLRRGCVGGPAAIFLSILQVVNRLEPVHVRLVLDADTPEERTVAAPMEAIFVMNTRTTGGGLAICPTAVMDDGFLDVCLMRDMTRADFLATLPKAYSGRHVGHPKVDIYRARSVRVDAERPLVKMFDGDLFGDAPLAAKVRPRALRLLVPAARAVR